MGVRGVLAVMVALTSGVQLAGCRKPEASPAAIATNPAVRGQEPVVRGAMPEAPPAAEVSPQAQAEAPRLAEAPKPAEPAVGAEAPGAAAAPQAEPSPRLEAPESGEEEFLALLTLPCKQVLELGPEGYVATADRADEQMVLYPLLNDMVRRYRKCRRQTVQAQYDALSAAAKEGVQVLQDGLEDFAISVHGSREQRVRGNHLVVMRKRTGVILRGEDLVAEVVRTLATSEAKEPLGKEGFAPMHKKAMDFFGLPVHVKKGTLEEKTALQYAEGMLRSTANLERALSPMPVEAARPVLAHMEEILKQNQ